VEQDPGLASERGFRGDAADSAGARPLPIELRRPRVLPGHVPRRHLVARLLTTSARVILICGPAGSGKTTLLWQWTEEDARPQGWLQLDASHNDPVTLVRSLTDALEGLAPVDPMVGQWARLATPPLRERILPSLRTAMEQAPPFLFVLDDGQALTSMASWDIIHLLTRSLPQGAQMALAARSEPRLPLGRLQAMGRILEIGPRDLAFDAFETAELLRQRGRDAGLETAMALQAATEGWAAGISLAAVACDEPCTPEWVSTIRGDQRAIARYLTAEVLRRQSRAVRSFLLQTSILECLSAGSCRAVTGRTDAGDLLERIHRDNLFLVPLDATGQTYRYHHLFAELLRAELERHDGGSVPGLHRRAAAWYEEHGDVEAAVRHLVAAGDASRAGDILYRTYFMESHSGQVDITDRRLEPFSEEQIQASVPLALTAGWLGHMTGDVRLQGLGSDPALDGRADDTPLPGGGTQRLFQLCLRAVTGAEGVSRMREDAERAAALAADEHPFWRATVNSILGAALWLSGDVVGAEAAIRLAVRDVPPHNAIAEVAANAYLSHLLADQGRWEDAEAYSRHARICFERSGLGLMGPTLLVPLSEARLLAHRRAPGAGELMRAVEDAMVSLNMPPWRSLTAQVMLGETALDLADLTAADRWAADAGRTLASWPDAGILRDRLSRLRRTLDERLLIEHLTKTEQRVLELLATHFTLPEIAARLRVSQNTLKTHLRSLYRKVDVHSRSEAVARARELGLLRH
jgi:LuxR family transcriptional regulator, maltose regulon positive regulatory protein